MKKQTIFVIKHIFALLLIIGSWISFGIFLTEEAGTRKGFYLSLFALTLIPISLFWWKFSKKGKLHPEFKKVFWGYSLALIFFVSLFSDLLSGVEFEHTNLYLAIDFTFSTIFILLFIFLMMRKNSQIESKELEIKNERGWEDSKPFHLTALRYLKELLDLGAKFESKKDFKIFENPIRLLESKNLCEVVETYLGDYLIILEKENFENINKKINITDFLEANFSDKETIESFAQKLF